MDVLTAKHSSAAGDLISVLPGLSHLHQNRGNKVAIYQRLGMSSPTYEGSVHAFVNENGDMEAMNAYMFKMLLPLMEYQPYIQSFSIFSGERHDYDFDLIRQNTFTNQPYGSINRWPFYVFPELACDLSKPWLFAPDYAPLHKVIINFTERSRNPFVNYFFLKEYEKILIFAGTQKEHKLFCEQWELAIPILEVDDFLTLAARIKSCKFFLGNQSLCFQIAEALKIPRILEAFSPMPNNIPIGDKAYDFYSQNNLEYYFKKLL